LKPRYYLPAAAALAAATYIAFHFGALRASPHVSDEVVYLFQARTLARGALAAPAPAAPAFFYYLNVVVDGARGVWFGIYPPGWPAALAPFVTLGAPFIANAVINALALLLVYRLGCELFGRRVGLLALALGLLSPFAWAMGASFLSHPLALLLTTAALLGATVGPRTGEARYYLLAGGAVGALATVRPLDAAVVAVTLAFLLLRRRRARGLLLTAAAAAPFALLLLLYNRALTGSAFLFPQQLYNARDALGFGAGVGKIATYGSVGHTPAKALFNLGANVRALSTNLFGWPFVSLAFVPFAYLTRRRRWRRGAAALTLFAGLFVLAYGLYWYDGVIYGARFYYTLMPFWLLLTAAGAANVHRFFRRRRASRWLVPAVMVGLFAFSLGVYTPHYVRKLRASYNAMDGSVYAAARRAGVAEGVVLCPPYTRAYPSYGGVFWRNSPWLDTPVIWARDLGVLSRQLRRIYPRKSFWRYEEGEVLKVRSGR